MKTVQGQGVFNFGPYRGYYGRAEYDSDCRLWHGQVSGIRDVITFQGKTIEESGKAFAESVEDYIAFCQSRGEEPERPYSGKFVVRIAPAVHEKISTIASSTGISLNQLIASRLEELVESVYPSRSRSGIEKAKVPSKLVGSGAARRSARRAVAGNLESIRANRAAAKRSAKKTTRRATKRKA